jgi:hypothetical protein
MVCCGFASTADGIRVEPDDEGVIRSAALPGLWFNSDASDNRDHARLFETIVRGIETDLPEKYWSIYRA